MPVAGYEECNKTIQNAAKGTKNLATETEKPYVRTELYNPSLEKSRVIIKNSTTLEKRSLDIVRHMETSYELTVTSALEANRKMLLIKRHISLINSYTFESITKRTLESPCRKLNGMYSIFHMIRKKDVAALLNK